MILPTKHIGASQSLLGVGALVLKHLDTTPTLTELWEQVRKVPEVGTFKRFVLSLDLLYAIGAVTLEDGLLKRTQP